MIHPVIREDKLIWHPLGNGLGVPGAKEGKKYLVAFEQIEKGELVSDMRVCKWWSDSLGFGLSSELRGIAYAEITNPVV